MTLGWCQKKKIKRGRGQKGPQGRRKAGWSSGDAGGETKKARVGKRAGAVWETGREIPRYGEKKRGGGWVARETGRGAAGSRGGDGPENAKRRK